MRDWNRERDETAPVFLIRNKMFSKLWIEFDTIRLRVFNILLQLRIELNNGAQGIRKWEISSRAANGGYYIGVFSSLKTISMWGLEYA